MLRIKPEVDLKELGKFGFYENKPFNYIKMLVDTGIEWDAVCVDIKTRRIERIIKEIYLPERNCKRVCEKYIQDLIDAGLVEEVVE